MSSIDPGDPRGRCRVVTDVKGSLRDLRNRLSLLNRQVGAQLELKDVDLDCLDLISVNGPIGPTALTRIAGLHPATTTGILDRLERGGWIVRERTSSDRRAVTVRPLPDRARQMYRVYSGMNAEMDNVCAEYSLDELRLIADFLKKATTAGQHAAAAMADQPK